METEQLPQEEDKTINDSYDELEVFFGPVSEKEREISTKFCYRRNTVLSDNISDTDSHNLAQDTLPSENSMDTSKEIVPQPGPFCDSGDVEQFEIRDEPQDDNAHTGDTAANATHIIYNVDDNENPYNTFDDTTTSSDCGKIKNTDGMARGGSSFQEVDDGSCNASYGILTNNDVEVTPITKDIERVKYSVISVEDISEVGDTSYLNDTIEEMEHLLRMGELYQKNKGNIVGEDILNMVDQVPRAPVNSPKLNVEKELERKQFLSSDDRCFVDLSQITPPRDYPPLERPALMNSAPVKLNNYEASQCQKLRQFQNFSSTKPSNLNSISSSVLKASASKLKSPLTKTSLKSVSSNLFLTPHNKIKPQYQKSQSLKKDATYLSGLKPSSQQTVSKPLFLTPRNKFEPKYQKFHSLRKATPQSYPIKEANSLSIVSPVAKYLQENPPPPLIATVKPRCKISPFKIKKGNLFQKKPISTTPSRPLPLQNKATPIQRECSPLPSYSYKAAKKIFQLPQENKENRRDIPTPGPVTSVVKHKGRIQVPKDILNSGVYSPARKDPSEKIPRISVVDVSVYEPHSVHRTNTLRNKPLN